jgi:hypothetical protein
MRVPTSRRASHLQSAWRGGREFPWRWQSENGTRHSQQKEEDASEDGLYRGHGQCIGGQQGATQGGPQKRAQTLAQRTEADWLCSLRARLQPTFAPPQSTRTMPNTAVPVAMPLRSGYHFCTAEQVEM